MSFRTNWGGFERWREEKSYTSCLQTCMMDCISYKISPRTSFEMTTSFFIDLCTHSSFPK